VSARPRDDGPPPGTQATRQKKYKTYKKKTSEGMPSQVYLQQNKKKAEAKGKNCHAKTMWSLEKPI
jgi:hypothetical protein